MCREYLESTRETLPSLQEAVVDTKIKKSKDATTGVRESEGA
jgi:hypothetical protein